MSDIAALVADNLDVWTGAIERKSGAGRGGGKRISLYGIDRLRALILDLAVRGKLVPQDAGDEPAIELLKRVRAERFKLVKAKEIGKGKSFPTVSDTPPFAIPANWAWTQISEIGHDWGQKEPESSFTYIDVGSVDQTLGVVHSPNVLLANDAPSRARKIVRPGTILYSTVRPYLLNIAVIDTDFNPEPIASTAFAIIHPYSGVDARFIYRYLRSPAFVEYVECCQTGIAYPAINDRQFFASWCPLPPQAEQQRIVAKVDELMALCDALERESAGAMAAHQALVEILLATLVNSADATDLARDWERLERHFDTLFTTDASIDALKQTILDLAVRGRLSSDLTIDWAPKCLGAYVTEASAGWSPKCIETPRDGDQWAVLKVSAVTWGTFKPTENKQLPDALEPRPSIEVRPGDFLISRANTADLVARSVVVPADAPTKLMMSDKIIRFRFTSDVDPKYVSLFHSTTAARTYYSRIAGGTSSSMKNVSQGQIRGLQLPVPPLAEQQRIVAKVDALMALCDTLKAGFSKAAQIQRNLADAITERAAA